MRGVANNPVICKQCGSKKGFPKRQLCRLCQMNQDGIYRPKRIWTDGEIELLREAYSGSYEQLRARRKRLSELSGLTRAQIDSKARQLGLCSRKAMPYTPIELKYISDNVREMTIEQIAQTLGRSASGVKTQVYNMRLSARLSREGYDGATLAQVMGVPRTTVYSWIKRKHLRTYDGKISEASVKDFLTTKPYLYTLARVDEFWFKNLIFGQ